MELPPPLPADLTDEEHRKVLIPPFVRFRDRRAQDPVVLAKADRLAELRQDNLPINLEELESARNRALRQGMRRLYEMKPQELIGFVEVLDGEIAARRVTNSDGPGKTKATRAEMLQALNGSTKEVQK